MTSRIELNTKNWLADMRCVILLLAGILMGKLGFAQSRLIKVGPYEIGQCDSTGKPVGIWNYFDERLSLSLTINYDNQQLLYFKDLPDNRNVIWLNNQWVQATMKRPARYLGSLSDFRYNTEMFFDAYFGSPYRFSGDTTEYIFWVNFTVTEQGNVTDVEVVPELKNNYKSFREEFVQIAGTWIPGIYNNQEVNYRFTIPVILCYKQCPQLEDLQPYTPTSYGQIIYKAEFSKYSSKSFKVLISPFISFASQQID